jgi:hypothetical protein
VVVIHGGSVANVILLQIGPEGESSSNEGISHGMFLDCDLSGGMEGVLDDQEGLLGESDVDGRLALCGQVGETGDA